MKNNSRAVFVYCVILLSAIGCSKKTDTYQTDQLTDYLQLAPGKYITYRLDSLEYGLNFGLADTMVSYLARDVIDTLITDNLGRPSWRIIRYYSDTTGTGDWTAVTTYMLTPTRQSVETVEDNMRFIKLVLPITDGVTWKGNSYIDTRSASSTVPYLDNWDYTYANTGQAYQLNSGSVPSTVTVNQQDISTGDSTDASTYSDRTLSVEVYGKGIGMIYKNFLHWEYQPPGVNPQGFKTGYGITLSMIDHN